MKRLFLSDGCMRYADQKLVDTILADLKARGVRTARVYEVPMYGIEVSENEWETAKAANKARREAKRAAREGGR